MEAPSDRETNLLKMFRLQIRDLDMTDEDSQDRNLVRYIRAREMNLTQAEVMLRNDLEWREKNSISSLLSWVPPASLCSSYPYRVSGFDNKGCPIVILPFGKWDVRKAAEEGHQDDFLRMSHRNFEAVWHLMKRTSKNAGFFNQFVIICDFDGYAYRQLASIKAVQACMNVVRNFDLHYPETLQIAFAVNCPSIFSLLHRLTAPMVSAKTLAKLRIHPVNSPKLKPELLELMEEDQFPAKYGGTGRNSTNILYSDGVEAPDQNANSRAVSPEDMEEEDFVKKSIAAGKHLDMDYDIKKPDSLLSWVFKTETCDIGFSVSFEGKVVVPYTRVTSDKHPHSGSFLCEKPGKYIITFDNSFSRFRSKTVRYIVSVIHSGE